MQFNLSQWLEKQEAINESQVDELLANDPSASCEMKRKMIRNKEVRREKVKLLLAAEDLEETLKEAIGIIYQRVPRVTKPSDWNKIQNELSNIRSSTEAFLNKNRSLSIDPSVRHRDILGLSDTTLITLYSFCLTLFDSYEYNKAIKICTFLTTVAPEVPSFWLAFGRSHQFNGNYHEALNLYERGKSFHPEIARFYLFSAECHDALENDKEMQLELDKLKGLADVNSENKELWQKVNLKGVSNDG